MLTTIFFFFFLWLGLFLVLSTSLLFFMRFISFYSVKFTIWIICAFALFCWFFYSPEIIFFQKMFVVEIILFGTCSFGDDSEFTILLFVRIRCKMLFQIFVALSSAFTEIFLTCIFLSFHMRLYSQLDDFNLTELRLLKFQKYFSNLVNWNKMNFSLLNQVSDDKLCLLSFDNDRSLLNSLWFNFTNAIFVCALPLSFRLFDRFKISLSYSVSRPMKVYFE